MAALTYTLYRGKEKIGRVTLKKGRDEYLYGVKVSFEKPQRKIEAGEDRAELSGHRK